MWPSEFQLEQLYRASSPKPANDFVAIIKASPFASRLSSDEKWIVAKNENRRAFEIVKKYKKLFVFEHLNYAAFQCHDNDEDNNDCDNLETDLNIEGIPFQIKEANVFTKEEADSFMQDFKSVVKGNIPKALEENVINYFTKYDSVWTKEEQKNLFVLMTPDLEEKRRKDFDEYLNHFRNSIPYFWENMCVEGNSRSGFNLMFDDIWFKNSSGANFMNERTIALRMFRKYHNWLKQESVSKKAKKAKKARLQ